MKKTQLLNLFSCGAILFFGASLFVASVEAADDKAGSKAKSKAQAEAKAEAGELAEAIAKGERAQPNKNPKQKQKPAPVPSSGRRLAPVEKRPYIGVALGEVDPAVRAHLDLPAEVGVSVNHIIPGSPAAQAGVKEHDILTRLDDQILMNPRQLQVLVGMKKKGNTVTLTLLRKGTEKTIEVTLGETELAAAPPAPSFGRPWVMPRQDLEIGRQAHEQWRERYEDAMKDFRGNLEKHQEALRSHNDGMAEKLREQMRQHQQRAGKPKPPLPPGGGQALKPVPPAPPRPPHGGGPDGAPDSFPLHVYADGRAVAIDSPQGKLRFHSVDGEGSLKVMNEKGEVIFDGALKIPAELEDLPERAMKILQGMNLDTIPFLAPEGSEEAEGAGGNKEVEAEEDVEIEVEVRDGAKPLPKKIEIQISDEGGVKIL